MANRLADMHEIAPELTEAVAKRITTADLHDKALRDLGAFVHRTIVEDEHTYAVRIDDGALLDAAEQIDRARPHLTADGRRQLAASSAASPTSSTASSTRSPRAPRPGRSRSRITREIRDRARNGRYAYVHDRGQDFADGIWVVNPVFMIDLVHEHLARPTTTSPPARRRTSPAPASTTTSCATPPPRTTRAPAHARARHAEATSSNLGLGHDIRAGLMDPTDRPAARAQGRSSATCSSATTAT